MHHDATALKNTHTDSFEQRSEALAIVSHDLKSPLSAILGAAEHLLHHAQLDQKGNRECIGILELIMTAGRGMEALIGDILIMERIEAGREAIHPEWLDDLGGYLRGILETFRYEAAVKDIHLSLELAEPLPRVCWDSRKLHYHAINNVLSNALKFTPAGGTIKLSASPLDNNVMIRIQDSGPGIPESERERIFDRFQRLEVRTARAYKSTGLGLYNAALFVRQHGGSITVSEGPGNKGATFTLRLPTNPPALHSELTASSMG